MEARYSILQSTARLVLGSPVVKPLPTPLRSAQSANGITQPLTLAAGRSKLTSEPPAPHILTSEVDDYFLIGNGLRHSSKIHSGYPRAASNHCFGVHKAFCRANGPDPVWSDNSNILFSRTVIDHESDVRVSPTVPIANPSCNTYASRPHADTGLSNALNPHLSRPLRNVARRPLGRNSSPRTRRC
jgi:hypothetical protein